MLLWECNKINNNKNSIIYASPAEIFEFIVDKGHHVGDLLPVLIVPQYFDEAVDLVGVDDLRDHLLDPGVLLVEEVRIEDQADTELEVLLHST